MMKPRDFLLFVCFCFFCVVAPSLVFGQSKNLVKDAEVELRYVETARIDSPTNPPQAENLKVKWLKILVTYSLGGTESKSKREIDASRWIDEMSIKFEVIYPASFQGKDVAALISGKVKFWSVPADGKKHMAVGYVPPQVLNRYKRTGAKFRNRDAQRKLYVKVTFLDKNQRIIGGVYAQPKGESPRSTASKFAKIAKTLNVLRLEGLVLPRNKTPWENLNWSKYQLIDLEDK